MVPNYVLVVVMDRAGGESECLVDGTFYVVCGL
jgi:hypothetical protein